MLQSFVKKYSTKLDNFNYVLLTEPFGRFYINDSDPEVMADVHKCIESLQAAKQDFGLAERHQEDQPELLYYDIDLLTSTPTTITEDLIKEFVSIFQNIVSHHVINADLQCVLAMQSLSSYEREGHHKLGLHIYFPFVCLHAEERQYVYEKVIEEFYQCEFFNKFDLYEKNLKEIIDHRVIRKNFILKYGCNKASKTPYTVYKVYGNNQVEISAKYDWYMVLSIRKNLWLQTPIVSQLTVELPKKDDEDEGETKHVEAQKHFSLEDIKKLVSILSTERATHYDTWVKVGLCLHNISDSDEMLKVWVDWSKKVPEKSKKTNFKKEWCGFQSRTDGLGYGSLVYWASIDNPTQYSIYNYERVVESIKGSLKFESNPYATDIAQVLKDKFYKKKFICNSIKHNSWYEFKDHMWQEMHEGNTLYNCISMDLIPEYLKQEIELDRRSIDVRTKMLGPVSEEEKNRLSTELQDIGNEKKKITKLISALKRSSFKKEIFWECKNMFYDEEFDRQLNEKRNLIVFNNGVFDLDKMIFRAGEPSDYMSYTTQNNYVEYDENNPDVQKVYHVFSQIHPGADIRNFFFYTLAASLHGYKREQKLDIWTGVGSNGKSITVDFISKALGDYFYSPSVTLLTRKRGGSSNATPDLIKLKGVRIGVLQEPEFDDILHTSLMKQLTGNDWIDARQLYREPVRFKPQLSLFMACNDLPKIPSNDGGTWRRIRVLQFKSKFVSKPSKEGEFPMDPSLITKIETLAPAFLSILLHYYGKLKKNQNIYKEPTEVLKFTNEYKKDNDIIQDFIEDNVEETGNDKDYISCKELHAIYLEWKKENYPTNKPLSIQDFKRQMVTKFGELPPKKRGWNGIRTKDDVQTEGQGTSIF